jgi:hypothetical protein
VFTLLLFRDLTCHSLHAKLTRPSIVLDEWQQLGGTFTAGGLRIDWQEGRFNLLADGLRSAMEVK